MPARLDAAENRFKCRFCDSHVSDDFRRTLGDEDNVAHRCLACDSCLRIQAGSAAGKNVDYPDPADEPSRDRGPSASSTLSEGGVER